MMKSQITSIPLNGVRVAFGALLMVKSIDGRVNEIFVRFVSWQRNTA